MANYNTFVVVNCKTRKTVVTTSSARKAYSPSNHEASRVVDTDGICPTVKENHGTVTAIVEPIVCEFRTDEGLRFFKENCCGTLRTSEACENKRVIIPTNNKKGYDEAIVGDSINLEQPNSTTRRGRVGHGVAQTLNTSPQQAVVENFVSKDIVNPQIQQIGKLNSSQDGVVVDSCGIAPTHTAGHGNSPKIVEDLRIRKLTPKECWRLMGFDDADFEKSREGK